MTVEVVEERAVARAAAGHGLNEHSVLLLGVRHHGPGSARSVAAALERFAPDRILIEGPVDADSLIPLVGFAGMEPPVALLAYREQDPAVSAFWPFAAFSPEWSALRYAVGNGVPAGFCDLPAAVSLTMDRERREEEAKRLAEQAAAEALRGEDPAAESPEAESPEAESPDDEDERGDAADGHEHLGAEPSAPDEAPRITDPLARLAHAAGYEDADSWWEDVVEHRGPARLSAAAHAALAVQPDRQEQPGRSGGPGATGQWAFGGEPLAAFAAIAEAMTAVREDEDQAGAALDDDVPGGGSPNGGGNPRAEYDAIREAHMRTVLRAAIADGAKRIAVVCGAYHVPALTGFGTADAVRPPSAASDKALLSKAPKPTKATATAITWVPWTNTRLSYHSGYGAGISSPGWYQHLFDTEDHITERWLTSVAELLRAERYPVSSAHLIEGVRLAETLAQVRGRPMPGLPELTEATLAVLCEGREEPLGLISRQLIVGEALGTVPSEAPTVPLAADLTREAKRLRVPKAEAEKTYDLDLRNTNDLERSKLFRRLGLIGVDWAVDAGSRGTGTFRESWQVAWEPVFEVKIAEAAVWGTTVLSAATAKSLDSAAQSTSLGSLTVLVERCLAADLPDAVTPLIELVKNRAALDTDIADLATALPPLAAILRYGDVRGTRTDDLNVVVEGIAARISIGLPAACVAIDDDAARALAVSLGKVHTAIQTLDEGSITGPWVLALRQTADLSGANGLLVGRATRLLRDLGRFDQAEIEARMARALSHAVDPAAAASWLEGFLDGAGLLLAHDPALLGLIDGWLSGLDPDRFEETLPLLRRTFSSFSGPERRTIGDRVRVLSSQPAASSVTATAEIDGETAASGTPAAWIAAALPTVYLLLNGTDGSNAATLAAGPTTTPEKEAAQ